MWPTRQPCDPVVLSRRNGRCEAKSWPSTWETSKPKLCCSMKSCNLVGSDSAKAVGIYIGQAPKIQDSPQRRGDRREDERIQGLLCVSAVNSPDRVAPDYFSGSKSVPSR